VVLLDYLEKFTAMLPDSQRLEIQKILGDMQASGTAKSEDELQKALEEAISELGKIPSQPTMEYRPQVEQTSSKDYNDTWQEIRADLRTIFAESAKIDQVLVDHQRLDNSIISNISKGIKKLEDKITAYETLFDNSEGYVQNTYETFRDKNSFADEKNLLLDRDGNMLQAADIDNLAETLVLPTLSNYNQIITESGSKTAIIKITDQVGAGFIMDANKKHSITNAIDGSEATFWCEVILADQPLTVPWIDPDNTDGYILTNGAACKFQIEFQNIYSVSEITIKPFSEFPIEILGIWAYESLNIDAKKRRLISEKRESESEITIQFPAVECQKLEFIINQTHYTKQTYLVSNDQVRNVELWRRIYDQNLEPTTSIRTDTSIWDNIGQASTGLDSYVNEFEKEFSNIVRAPENYGISAPTNLNDYEGIGMIAALGITGNSNDKTKVSVNKYEYVYGAYEISVRGKSFASKGVYVSKPIRTKGNTKQTSLVTSETHTDMVFKETSGELVLFDTMAEHEKEIYRNVKFRATSTEWYISPKEMPNNQDWLPIIPTDSINDADMPYIHCEVLMPIINAESQIIATTRFPFYQVGPNAPIIRANGKRLTEVLHYLLIDTKNIQIVSYEPNSIYSIEYSINSPDDPRILDFESNLITPLPIKDVFTTGTDRRQCVTLSYYPYVDYEVVNTTPGYDPNNTDIPPIKVYIRTSDKNILPATGTTTTNRTVNMTDYITQTREILQPYDPDDHSSYDYRHDGQTIAFADDWASGTAITVEYYYQISDMRLKAILRRSVPGFESISPIVHDYSVKLRTINKI
jgi:hypothetical protein